MFPSLQDNITHYESNVLNDRSWVLYACKVDQQNTHFITVLLSCVNLCLSDQVREEGRETFGTKVEVKNMNSFSAMQRAIDFEIDRQVSLTQL